MDNDDMVKKIKNMVKEFGSQKLAAFQLEISEQYLSDIVNGRREVSDEVAKKLGFQKLVVYEKIKE